MNATPETLVPFEPPERLGKALLLERLAYGGSSEILLARFAPGEAPPGHENELFAIKRLLPHMPATPDNRERLERERSWLGRAAHPALPKPGPLNSGPHDTYLSMEWIAGVDLRDLQARRAAQEVGVLAPDAVAYIVSEAAGALGALAQAAQAPGEGVHRDISPRNLMAAFDGRVVLTDLGLVTTRQDADFGRGGYIVGTFAYMAPEQARGEPIDARADQYALAAVAYECLTGRRWRPQATHADRLLAAQNATGTVVLPPALAAAVPVLDTALHAVPAGRFESPRAFAEALAAALEADLEGGREALVRDVGKLAGTARAILEAHQERFLRRPAVAAADNPARVKRLAVGALLASGVAVGAALVAMGMRLLSLDIN